MHDKGGNETGKVVGVIRNNNLVLSFFFLVSNATATWKVGRDVTEVSVSAEPPPVCTMIHRKRKKERKKNKKLLSLCSYHKPPTSLAP
jgi:hypothetical protein